MKPEIKIFGDPAQVAREAALEFVRLAAMAVAEQDRCAVALAGGSTPKSLYSLLAADESLRRQIPWDKLHFFWGDERHVPPDHKDSNYRMAYEAMLSKVPVPSSNVHRIKAEEADAQKTADGYEQELQSFFQLEPDRLPRFDLVLLGMGPDGHTASLFPDSPGLTETRRIFIANRVESMNTDRLTFTYPVLNAAACDMFLVSGNGKKEKVRQILKEHQDFPASRVDPQNGELLWFLDRAAAGE